MLKELIEKYGKDKINTLTKYPSILTLHKIGDKGVLTNELTTPITSDDEMSYSEKIDGTNGRIIIFGDEHLIGAREFILHHNHDLYYDNSQGIVDGIRNLEIKIPETKLFTVIYGEFYGGKTSANSKWYGTDKIGYRVFDIAQYHDLSILEKSLSEISRWREHETDKGIVYGQNFLNKPAMMSFNDFEFVPNVEFELGDMSHQTILDNLKKFIPTSKAALSDMGTKKTEGVVGRNFDRTKIIKIRFEDYERTLKNKK